MDETDLAAWAQIEQDHEHEQDEAQEQTDER
jgi:hypothetical protein